MNITKYAVGVASALLFAMPVLASAAVDNVLFNNGTTGSVTAVAGATIPMDILISSTGTDVDSVWVNFPGAGGAAQVGRCYDITPNQIGSSPAGGWTVHVDLDRTPLNANLWDMTVSTYGLDAVDAEDNTCSTGVDFTHTFNGNDRRVTITADASAGSGANNSGGSGMNNGSGTGSSAGTPPSWFTTWLTGFQGTMCTMNGGTWSGTQCTHPTPTPAPTSNQAKCDLARPYLGAQPYAYSSVGTQLQSAIMLDDPHAIPALDNTLHPNGTVQNGFFGAQTHQALTSYSSKYGCNFIFN